jgi:hypothetical protein
MPLNKSVQTNDALAPPIFVGGNALGLCRSTAWFVLQADHKNSGLTATVVDRILAAPHLPQAVHDKILEYVAEKSAGLYGHCPKQRRRFLGALSARVARVQNETRA